MLSPKILSALSLPLILLSTGWVQTVYAQTLRSDHVHQAEGKKTNVYIKDGVFVGGDKAINHVTVKEIRRSVNSAYERLVLDLEGSRNGEPAALNRAPSFHVAVNPDEKRVIVTLSGKSKLAFDPKKVAGLFKQSRLIRSIELYPQVEEDSWMFALNLKSGRPVEVFELTDSARIIIDLRSEPRSLAEPVSASHGKTTPAHSVVKSVHEKKSTPPKPAAKEETSGGHGEKHPPQDTALPLAQPHGIKAEDEPTEAGAAPTPTHVDAEKDSHETNH